MNSMYLLNWLEEMYPNTTTTTELSIWEYGIKAGERMLIEQLKIKLKIQEEQEQDEVK